MIHWRSLLLHEPCDQQHQKHEHERVDHDAHLGRHTGVIGDEGAEHWEATRDAVGHGVGNKEEQDECESVGHLILFKNINDDGRDKLWKCCHDRHPDE